MDADPVKLVVFDVGGVLIRCVKGWSAACQRAGVPDILQGLTPAQRRDLSDLATRFELGRLSADRFAAAVRARSGYSQRQVYAALEAWFIEPHEGIADLIDRVHRAGVRTAILTNTNPAHWTTIGEDVDRFGAIRRIQHHFASHLMGLRKPQEHVYTHVERSVGVRPQQILFFDDKEENLHAAAMQWWRTELINPDRPTALQLERYLIRHGILNGD